jgi:hypothetical protein
MRRDNTTEERKASTTHAKGVPAPIIDAILFISDPGDGDAARGPRREYIDLGAYR